MKEKDGYIWVGVSLEEKERLKKIASQKGTKLSVMIYEEYLKKILYSDINTQQPEINDKLNEIVKEMKKYNQSKGSLCSKNDLYAVIVFSQDNFDVDYSIDSRSYYFGNTNPAFLEDDCPIIMGSSIDDSDKNIRLDKCINEWIIEDAYLINEKDLLDRINDSSKKLNN